MVTVKNLIQPASLDEAALYTAHNPQVPMLAGGTFLLAHPEPLILETVLDISRIVPKFIDVKESEIIIGSGTTFQELLESNAPPIFIKALLTMSNRNIRNRATVGGNIGANKSCASLIPIFLLLDAKLKVTSSKTLVPLQTWLHNPQGIILEVHCNNPRGLAMNFTFFRRTSCDLSSITAAVAYKISSTRSCTELRIVLGGFSKHAELRPDIASLFEGTPVPSDKQAIRTRIQPLLHAITDQRGSAEYKEYIGAEKLAEALMSAEVQP
ncbi:MAG TPA: FAD binding domain-containing protein [Spirochaetia bacterium]|nr:FAD binding domain-containing protein [Spirochaetales bacterium]HRS64430.1 FAD binding domain-containing protein [Spirochaetia bacterium]HOT58291.1 FAD binding domain-containing protein [Spirochaetales bacterium]HPD79957.1 FAD binding domain-containing protein [Spirochaetales bacterium]HQK33738.1 FAD binding domain-containing protein [Spirochaetales bacterium]